LKSRKATGKLSDAKPESDSRPPRVRGFGRAGDARADPVFNRAL